MLSVIVCTYNREKYLMPLFESIAANTLPFDRYELLVIDNNCTDGTADVCRRFAEKHPDVNFRALKETTQGLSAARNCGIRNAAGELVLYVDDDALVGTDYLQTYVDWFESHPRTMAAGGPIEPMYEDCTEPVWMTSYTKSFLAGWMNLGNRPLKFPKGKYPIGCNCVFRKEVFDTVGLFNTELGRNGKNLMAGEEKDIFDKMRNNDMEIMYVPTAVLHHIVPPSKLSRDYFDRVTYMTGVSERQRTKDISNRKYLMRLFQEAVKWGGTIVLFIGYTVRLTPSKGCKLILFRKNVTKGLIGL